MDNEDLLALFAGCITKQNEVDVGACLVAADKLEELGFEMESDLLRTVDRSRKVLRFTMREPIYFTANLNSNQQIDYLETVVMMRLGRAPWSHLLNKVWTLETRLMWLVCETRFPYKGGKGENEITKFADTLPELFSLPNLFSGKHTMIYDGLAEIKYEETIRQPSAFAKALFS